MRKESVGLTLALSLGSLWLQPGVEGKEGSRALAPLSSVHLAA